MGFPISSQSFPSQNNLLSIVSPPQDFGSHVLQAPYLRFCILCIVFHSCIFYYVGGSRYIPGGSSSQSGLGGEATDPFTGAGRYRPGTGGSGYAPTPDASRQGGGADPFTGEPRNKVLVAVLPEGCYLAIWQFFFQNRQI